MQTRIINSSTDSSGNVDSGVTLVNDKENKGNKHHVALDTTLDVSSSSGEANVDDNNVSSRLVYEMNDNNKQMSTSEKEKLASPPSNDSTVANNCNIMSFAKHNKMIDDQSSTTTADYDDKDINEKECQEVVTSDNTSTNKAANVSSSTICKSSNDDDQPSHNLEDTQSTTTANNLHNNINSTTTQSGKKETIQQRATNNPKGGGGPYSSSSSHIYALREIICSSYSNDVDASPTAASCEEAEYDLLNNEEEEEKKECSRPISYPVQQQKNNKVEEGEYHHPRIITSQIVKTSQDMYKLLECNTAGKVLCPCKQQQHHHGNSSSSRNADDETDDEVILTDTNGINFTACNVSSMLDQMKNMDIDGSSSGSTTLKMMKNCPISLTEEQCEKDTALPTKKKYLPIRIYKSIKRICQRSPIKHRHAKKKEQHRQQKPKMVIKNGIIDWTSCQNLENCNTTIDEHMLTVEYTNDSAQDEGMGTKKKQKKKNRKGKGKNRKGKKKDRGGTTLTTLAHNRDGTSTMPEEMKTLGSTIFSDESVINNTIKPINEVVCINKSLGIYVSESGLSASDCRNIINVSEHTAKIRGSWSSYTYAKQTLGCRENDALAFVCARPVMIACATICKHLIEEEDTDDDDDRKEDDKKKKIHDDDNDATTGGKVSASSDGSKPSSDRGDNDDLDTPVQNEDTKKKELVLDVREPHVVKYDTSKTERQKLDMHTDKSVWTFLIALSEGRGEDYGGGGTYFQALNSTVHLQRSQMIIFRGKRRHCGVAINSGCRYLLVGFLVPSDGMVMTTKKTDSKST